MKKKHKSAKDLQAAIETLNAFSRQKELSETFSIPRKIMSFAIELFSKAIAIDHMDVKHAIEVINTSSSLLQSFNEGTPGQMQLAGAVYAAVDRFNKVNKQIKQRHLPWRRWMNNLSIELPKSASKEFHCKIRNVESQKMKLNILLEKGALPLPSQQEIDAFRMKAITLLKHQEVRFTSLTEQLNMIREIPIALINDTFQSKPIAECIVSLSQTLSLFPGETLELKGAFKRYPQSHCRSIPIPDSFHISAQAHQTGFPHPSQHNGWGLSQIMLPEKHPIREKMNEIAHKLMPKGSLNIKAKELLKKKKRCFEVNAQEFLDLHRELNEAMLNFEKPNKNRLLDNFYEDLKKDKQAYIRLSNIHQQIINSYLNSPITSSLDTTVKSKEILKMPLSDQEFIFFMGTNYQQILKTKKDLLESLAIKQMQDFIFELEHLNVKTLSDMCDWIRETLVTDIKLCIKPNVPPAP